MALLRAACVHTVGSEATPDPACLETMQRYRYDTCRGPWPPGPQSVASTNESRHAVNGQRARAIQEMLRLVVERLACLLAQGSVAIFQAGLFTNIVEAPPKMQVPGKEIRKVVGVLFCNWQAPSRLQSCLVQRGPSCP